MSVEHYERTTSYFQTRVHGGDIAELAVAVGEFLRTAEDGAKWTVEGPTIVLEYSVGESLIPRERSQT